MAWVRKEDENKPVSLPENRPVLVAQ
jgi:hypothetical protein